MNSLRCSWSPPAPLSDSSNGTYPSMSIDVLEVPKPLKWGWLRWRKCWTRRTSHHRRFVRFNTRKGRRSLSLRTKKVSHFELNSLKLPLEFGPLPSIFDLGSIGIPFRIGLRLVLLTIWPFVTKNSSSKGLEENFYHFGRQICIIV